MLRMPKNDTGGSVLNYMCYSKDALQRSNYRVDIVVRKQIGFKFSFNSNYRGET